MLGREKGPTAIAADVASAITPYTDQLAHDPKLRQRLAAALRASVIAGARARRHTGTFGVMRGLASNPVFKRQIAEAIVDVQEAKRRIDRRRHRRTRVVTALVGLAAIAALVVPAIRLAKHGADAVDTAAGSDAA